MGGILSLGQSVGVEEDDAVGVDECFLPGEVEVGHDAQRNVWLHGQIGHLFGFDDERLVVAGVAVAQSPRRQVEHAQEERHEHERLVAV